MIVASPGRNFVTLKIVTDEGVYGIGDATLNGCAILAASAALMRQSPESLRLPDLPAIEWCVPAAKPLLFSEFGADAKAGFHDPALGQKFSEEFQADYYRRAASTSTSSRGGTARA